MKLRKADALKIGALAIIFFTGLYFGYQILKPQKSLPIYNPSQLDERLVHPSIQSQGLRHRTLNFSLSNQYGETVTEKTVEGKIVIADFFFTTCPSICKDMAVQMRRLQEEFKNDTAIVLLSHSVTPVADSVSVLAEYAQRQGALKNKWHLMTGDKPQIYKLARQSYFAVLDEGGNGNEDDFIHTENFVLVDHQRRIRGFYDGTLAEDVDRLVEDVRWLLDECD